MGREDSPCPAQDPKSGGGGRCAPRLQQSKEGRLRPYLKGDVTGACLAAGTLWAAAGIGASGLGEEPVAVQQAATGLKSLATAARCRVRARRQDTASSLGTVLPVSH